MTTIIPFDSKCRTAAGGEGALQPGEVCLLGAGPGDPELMTIKGMRALEAADVVVYDRLANPALLDFTGRHCDRIYVGKRKDSHSLPQEQICELLVALARCGKRVVRLKGGDPFIFGRGGEEIDRLEENGIPWRVIPGITAATGCAASTGIPLTHRECAHALTFITAHRRDGKLRFNWELALQQDQTVVFYMGLSVVAEIAAGLVARGKSAATPIAVIANGTRGEQQVMVSTLAGIGAALADHRLPSPALIVMGDVVALRGGLQAALAGAAVSCA
ncbi:MAG: uroporphyrinogen-III C-methyltransferase [Porticoccaceae bacterium]|jgi:uroporphyrin-III C-methyltransferase/precorrin-2 dehydrogenase/sirohydrochlorin ferrochelatase